MNQIYKPKYLYLVTKHPILQDLESTCLDQAITDPQWHNAISQELTPLMHHGTWDVVPQPANHNVMGCKWIFIVKRHPNGSVNRFIVRLVTKGFTQCPKLDYKETFSSIVKLATHNTPTSIVPHLNAR